MKTTIKEAPTAEKEIKFPVLARQNKGKLVVLFRDHKSGCVLVADHSCSSSLGNFEDWCPVTDNFYWQILPPGTQVILEQE